MYRAQHQARPVKRTLSQHFINVIPSPCTVTANVATNRSRYAYIRYTRENILHHALLLDAIINFVLGVLFT